MPDHSIHPRLPEGTERVVSTGIEPSSDGSVILTLVTVGPTLTLIEYRMFLDRYVTWSLLRTLARELDGIEDPGPTPEAAALLDAVRTDDQTAIASAGDGLNDRVLSLWADGNAAA
ncbi:hypothetical protein OG562_30880 [Streptomyces sp. NBC_01275]|uniref:hypothetical protein n=1 Tax=Streptomyces sp. NBC_01275 TaxID=2903807 RepID=UPI0022546655|nr:hypothetical protein [Streptomyces sp. NBC_01275]MCX4765304.1 hypothetical protein [Streptomyces sp. NBC_01275]